MDEHYAVRACHDQNMTGEESIDRANLLKHCSARLWRLDKPRKYRHRQLRRPVT